MIGTRKLGSLISLEGMDGCGKSTAVAYLKAAFEKHSLPVITTFEVGGTPIGKELRNLAFVKRADEQLDPLARLLLVYAARIQHIRQVIQPAVLAGTHVITDRYNDTTRIYQGKIDRLASDMDKIESVTPMRMLATRANYVIYFKVDTEVAYSRGKARTNVNNDTYKNDIAKADQINKYYDEYFSKINENNPGSVFIVDANGDLESVHKQLDDFVEMFLPICELW